MDLTRGLFVALAEFSDDAEERRSLARLDRVSTRIADAVAPSGEWDADASARVAAAFRTGVVTDDRIRPSLCKSDALILKVAKVAHALVLGSEVKDDDAAFVCRHLPEFDEEVDDECVAFEFPAAPADGVLPFAFTHHQIGSRGRCSLGRSSGFVRIDIVHADDAPVACRLRFASGDWIDVRQRDGTFLRPVLHPGCSLPIGVDAFATAARDGRAWADSPFLLPPRPGDVTLDIIDISEPADRSDPLLDHHMAHAMGDALARCGPLCVIDGIVHRVTPPPTLHVAAVVPVRRVNDLTTWGDDDPGRTGPASRFGCLPQGDLRFGWRMGSIDAFMSGDTFGAWWLDADWSTGMISMAPWAFQAGDHRDLESVVAHLCASAGTACAESPWEIIDHLILPTSGKTPANLVRVLIAEAVALGIVKRHAADPILSGREVPNDDWLHFPDPAGRATLAVLSAMAVVASQVDDYDAELANFQP